MRIVLVAALAALVVAPTARAAEAPCPEAQKLPESGAQNPSANIDATLWFQASAEYRASAKGIYAAATKRLAELARKKHKGKLAVVVDVDETVLDNSIYQAQLVLTSTGYNNPYKWNDWVAAEKATAIPGAVAFLNKAARLGVRVFYITNRKCDPVEACPQKLQTYCNLRAMGVRKISLDDFLLKGERAGWESDEKAPRRAAVEKQGYKIVLMMGDQLSDFVEGSAATSSATRASLEAANEAHWGDDWFLLPNPMYGDFASEKLIGGSKASALKGY